MVTLLEDGLGRLFRARSRRMRSRPRGTIGQDEILILLGPDDTRPRQAVFLVAMMGGGGRCRERHEGDVNTAATTKRKTEVLLSRRRWFGAKRKSARPQLNTK